MKNITLTEVEVNELVDMYEVEIDRAQRRINNLQSILRKLKSDFEEDVKKAPGRRGRRKDAEVKANAKSVEVVKEEVKAAKEQPAAKPKAARIKRATKKKVAKKTPVVKSSKYKAIKSRNGGEKVKWSDTIIGIMKEKNMPMLSSEIANEAIARLGIEENNVARAKSAVATNITKLLKNNTINKQPVTGKKGSLFALV